MQPCKIAIVSGASRGIGRAIAEHLADSGVGVVITYRSGRAEAESVVAGIVDRGGTAVALELDLSDLSALDPFVDETRTALRRTWNRDTFDYLVNNAGIAVAATFADTTESAFDELLAVNFKGVFFLTQRLVPLQASNGRIVNITGGLTRFTGPPTAAYAAMKGAVEVLASPRSRTRSAGNHCQRGGPGAHRRHRAGEKRDRGDRRDVRPARE